MDFCRIPGLREKLPFALGLYTILYENPPELRILRLSE
jgi:hypothetical protein